MTLSSPSREPAGATLGGPFARWFAPVAFLYLGYGWWQASVAQISGAAAAGSALPASLAGALAVGARLLGWLLESGYYLLWWRWRGRAFPFWRFFQWTAALSTVDLLADAVRRLDPTAAWARATQAWLTGPRLETGLNASTWMIAFGGAGLLTVLRLALVAHAQRRALNVRWTSPALLVSVTWVTGRLVLAWSRDLLTGASLR